MSFNAAFGEMMGAAMVAALVLAASWNVKHRKVGGIHFVRFGFLVVSFCVSKKEGIGR